MEDKVIMENLTVGGAESSIFLNKYHSVQFSLNDMGPTYLFKLRAVPANGLCILVKEDSSVHKKLNVGDVLNMDYNPPEAPNSSKRLKTQITSKNSQDAFIGHSLIGLSIVDQPYEN